MPMIMQTIVQLSPPAETVCGVARLKQHGIREKCLKAVHCFYLGLAGLCCFIRHSADVAVPLNVDSI